MMGRVGAGILATKAADGNWEGMGEWMREMMGPYRYGGGRVFFQFHWFLELVSWILVILLLIALVRWVWRKGDRK